MVVNSGEEMQRLGVDSKSLDTGGISLGQKVSEFRV